MKVRYLRRFGLITVLVLTFGPAATNAYSTSASPAYGFRKPEPVGKK
jgi:hypothetical protein